MQSTTGMKRTGLCFLACSAVLVTITPTLAWQFRELDDAAQDQVDSNVDATPVLEPTSQPFVAPVVNARAPIVNARDSKLEKPLVQPNVLPSTIVGQKPGKLSQPAPAKQQDDQAKNSPVPVAQEPAPVQPEPMPESIPKPIAATAEEIHPDPVETLEATSDDDAPFSAFGKEDKIEDSTTSNLVEPAEFKGARAGDTTIQELKQSWGEPSLVVPQDDYDTLVYQIPPFRQVEATISSGVVNSILIHLAEPLSAKAVATELGLNGLKPVPVPDEFGDVLGQAYPERGLMMAFSTELASLRVSAILLEPISAEMFRLRAQHDFNHNYEQSLDDLEEALRLNPKDAESYWLTAQLLDATGQSRKALTAAQEAVRLKPTQALYRLTRARIYAKTNRYASALKEVRSVINELDLPKEIAGRAHNLLGDLLTIGPKADYQDALKHHLKAIDFSMKEVDNKRFAARRMSKHVLVSAHMAVARDIAMGNFQRQKEVVPKWLVRATDMADEFINDDHGDESLRMQIFRETLSCYSELQDTTFDATSASEEAMDLGRSMIADAESNLYKIQIERLLAETLLHAAKIERTRGRYDNATNYANNALSLLESSKDDWVESSHDKYLKGELYFVLGSVNAIQHDDHYEAIEWYTKARDLFDNADFISSLYSARGFGEMQVSMGLSYWQIGDQEAALKITEEGGKLMKKAVESGSLQVDAMAVPYGNLATMHAKRGESNRSQEYAKLVARVEKLVKSKSTKR